MIANVVTNADTECVKLKLDFNSYLSEYIYPVGHCRYGLIVMYYWLMVQFAIQLIKWSNFFWLINVMLPSFISISFSARKSLNVRITDSVAVPAIEARLSRLISIVNTSPFVC